MKDSVPETPWNELSYFEKVKWILWVVVRLALLLACLYFFICSLGVLEDSFQLLGGVAAGKTFQNSALLTNPISCVMMGVLTTVLIQSSSASTSIIVTMVGSEVISIRSAVPIIMGANIGTSVTSTLVSLAQASDRNQFKRAFAGATVHDMFNWLTVLTLLPLEVSVHYLEWLTGVIVDSMHLSTPHSTTPDMLKAITKPLTTLIVEIDKDVIKDAANERFNNTCSNCVLKRWCDVNHHHHGLNDVTVDCQNILTSPPSATPSLLEMCRRVKENGRHLDLSNVSMQDYDDSAQHELHEKNHTRCDNLLAQSHLSDRTAGGILLVCSLMVIFLSLMGLMKILHSMLESSVVRVITKFINTDLPGMAAYFTGYIFILVGCGITMILQSSSIFTSTLTPLVGVGVVSIERMYPLTLGSNIGTTMTGVLAALSQEGKHVKNSMHVAMCHVFFNISGIVLFYPLPFLRLPITMANALGRTTAKYRWFSIVYLILLFILLPGAVIGLSAAGWVYLAAVGGSVLLLFLIILVINILQRKRPQYLPKLLRSWSFLPLWMRSLRPIDNLLTRVCPYRFCQKIPQADPGDVHSEKEEEEEEEMKVREK